VHFRASEHEELVTAWLWSERAGVMSHQTALSLHGLSDVLPAQIFPRSRTW
jgi:predicted transcriptional regulator of viral defense system